MIGLDISDRSIKAVELTNASNPRLRTACWLPQVPNIVRRGKIIDRPALANGIRQTLQKCKPEPTMGKEAVVSIPDTQTSLRVIDLPNIPDQEMTEAVKWKIKQQLPPNLGEMYVDWQRLSKNLPGENKQKVLVAFTSRQEVDSLLAVTDSLGLSVVALELVGQALVRSLLPQDSADISGVLIIDLGAVASKIILYSHGHIHYDSQISIGGDDLTRHLAQELKIKPSIAAEKKALVGALPSPDDEKIAALLKNDMLSAVAEIKKKIEQISSEGSESLKINTVLLTGGAANLPGLINIIAEVFPNIPVQLSNPWINLEIAEQELTPPLSLADSAHFATAIGLALRNNFPTREINLLPPARRFIKRNLTSSIFYGLKNNLIARFTN